MRKYLGVVLGCGIVAVGTLVAANARSANDVRAADDAVPPGFASFESCPDLLSHLKHEASDLVGPRGLQKQPGPVISADTADTMSAIAEPPSEPAQSAATIRDGGIEEPSVAQTDGELMVMTRDATLRVVDLAGEAPVCNYHCKSAFAIWNPPLR
jgi:hypothetical protein